MLEFKPITLADKAQITELVRAENSKSADTAFGTMYLWNDNDTRFVAISGSRVVLMLRDEKTRFLFPFGSGNIVPVINEMKEYADSIGEPLRIIGVTEEYIPLLNKLFPETFEITQDERYSDYVYTAEKLATLAGKALHGKRNHINSFISSHNWRFEPMRKEHIPSCIETFEKWRDADPEHDELDIFNERCALLRCLREYKDLSICGGVLWADDEIVAFTMGELLCADTFVVHFEKAVADIRGAFPMINREFVRYIMSIYPDVKYINREDDMGLENLRKAKQSYKPDMMILKFTAIWGDSE